MSKRFMISEYDEISTFQEKTEMADDRESSQKLMVEGGVAGLSVGQLPGEEGEVGPRLLHTLLQYSTHLCIQGIYYYGESITWNRMHKDGNGGENVSNTEESCIQGWSPIQHFTRGLDW